MSDLCKLILGMVIDLLRSRATLEAEILLLRQQINSRGSAGKFPTPPLVGRSGVAISSANTIGSPRGAIL